MLLDAFSSLIPVMALSSTYSSPTSLAAQLVALDILLRLGILPTRAANSNSAYDNSNGYKWVDHLDEIKQERSMSTKVVSAIVVIFLFFS